MKKEGELMKLTIQKFRKKNVCLKQEKCTKIPLKCTTCIWLSCFKNEYNTYYYCSKVNKTGILSRSLVRQGL